MDGKSKEEEEEANEEVARQLQQEEDDLAKAISASVSDPDLISIASESKRRIKSEVHNIDNNEEEDPIPDLHGLYLAFNDQYFHGKLSSIEVRWSSRMTLCAGMCYYYPGGYCSVRLSEPLLKLRPRSDYINTLLHEMIHAYLFVTQQNTDRDGHGPEFMKHAKRINAAAGTNITVYHNFRDEVNHYRVHVWKCNGPCQSLPPFFGTVKRSMNRPPQAADWWFAGHEKSCGGVYEKISGPEPKPKAKRKPKKKDDGSDEVIDKKKKKGKGPMDDFLTRGKPFSGNQLFDTFLAKLGASDTILLRGGHIKSDPTLNLKPPSPTPSPPSSPDLLALPTTSPSIIDLTSDPPLLTCPVCQKDGFEGTGSLNSHLDACLLEG